MHRWDPGAYLTYADERSRPFVELLGRIGATSPRHVVDLGAGPGTLTALLAQRWPEAEVLAVDSSPEMIARARQVPGISAHQGDLRDWRPQKPADVIVSNAALQWVPGHLDLLPRIIGHLAPGGWMAMQVPGNFEEPSHTIRAELAAEPRFAEHLRGIAVPSSHDPQIYWRCLTDLGCAVDAWETTYLHVLQGEDPVFDWVSGTGARPTLQALPEGLREEFTREYKDRLRLAYPDLGHGIVLPFRRVFAVARSEA